MELKSTLEKSKQRSLLRKRLRRERRATTSVEKPWTNEEENAHAPLNDYTATIIGMIRDEVPFNNMPLLPPGRDNVESINILKACIPARAALAELKQAGELLPNQSLLIESKYGKMNSEISISLNRLNNSPIYGRASGINEPGSDI